MTGTPTPGDVQQVRGRQQQEAAAKKALKAQRREENERNRAAKLARRARLALPPEARLGAVVRGGLRRDGLSRGEPRLSCGVLGLGYPVYDVGAVIPVRSPAGFPGV
ncbi:hypothetical protein [Streptomyces pacificus]|uniref:Uncharacterized protein n=1 Tax=Streptomyces pacificus TaxID=2705029 RepID=A0A6A0APN4_9ACTN|nr:hypothetical protein [Streptomyces pacificus]GFH34959.1 hypothetical protein SCWH03_11730 [Streptomyces pacificus]